VAEQTINDKKMPLLEHLVELRRRLIYSFIAFIVAFLICYHFSQDIFAFLVRPLADALKDTQNAHMIYTALHEAFFTYLKVGFWAALFVSFPVIASQLWMFVAPGLYRHEKRAFLPFLAATPVLFLMGAALVYYVIFPMAWHFFLSFQTPAVGDGSLPIEVAPKVDQYLSLSMQLIFAFGLGFELPVLLMLLVRVGIVSSAGLARNRRYAIVGAFVAAAVLTPPDVLSQFSLAIPLIILYEISVIGGRMIEKSRASREAAEAAREANDAVV
jgi:sec-independent protein translocase protein TatC